TCTCVRTATPRGPGSKSCSATPTRRGRASTRSWPTSARRAPRPGTTPTRATVCTDWTPTSSCWRSPRTSPSSASFARSCSRRRRKSRPSWRPSSARWRRPCPGPWDRPRRPGPKPSRWRARRRLNFSRWACCGSTFPWTWTCPTVPLSWIASASSTTSCSCAASWATISCPTCRRSRSGRRPSSCSWPPTAAC
ncbi:hypothetical protein H632_c5324p0, partial [Helicosporidium sp. ATCC 50920]